MKDSATRALFCDVGGVLIEDPWALAARRLSREHALDGAEAYAVLVRLSEALDLNELGIPELWKEFSDSVGARIPYAYFRRLVLDDSLVKIPSVWEAVRSLRRSVDFHVFALSNMSRPAWRILQRKYLIRSLFDGETLSYRCGVLKPDPRIFRIALENARRTSVESVFVDNLEANIATASSLGFRVYLASSPSDTARFIASINAER